MTARRLPELLKALDGREAEILRDTFGFTIPAKRGRGGPCPNCGGNDRFSWFFGKYDGKWRCHCRRCDLKGDLGDALIQLGICSDFSEVRGLLDEMA